MEEPKKPSWGGKRQGAGPKPKSESGEKSVALSMRIDPEVKRMIYERPDARAYIEELVRRDNAK